MCVFLRGVVFLSADFFRIYIYLLVLVVFFSHFLVPRPFCEYILFRWHKCSVPWRVHAPIIWGVEKRIYRSRTNALICTETGESRDPLKALGTSKCFSNLFRQRILLPLFLFSPLLGWNKQQLFLSLINSSFVNKYIIFINVQIIAYFRWKKFYWWKFNPVIKLVTYWCSEYPPSIWSKLIM